MTNRPKTTLLINALHGTEYRVRLSPRALDDRMMTIASGRGSPADAQWVRRVRGRLCGVAGCMCARTFLGTR